MALVAVAANATPGQPGTLDSTWGNGTGKVQTIIGNNGGLATAVAIQADGKIVLAGYCPNSASDDFCATRYLTNGDLDISFGTGGKVITETNTRSNYSNRLAIAVQRDGKIVLAGHCLGNLDYIDFCAVRYLPTGNLDTSFGVNGKVVTSIDIYTDAATRIAIQPDNKIVLVGHCYNGTNHFCALRYDADGTLDTSFGNGGKVVTSVGNSEDYAYAVALQPDGKLVLAGSCINNGNYDFCALRYHSDGTLDLNFGSGGKVISPIGVNYDSAHAIVLQPDGKLVLAGHCDVNLTFKFCALRYHADGSLDLSFGVGGKVTPTLGGSENVAVSLTLLPDGKLVLAGWCGSTTNPLDFCAQRYNPDGSIDGTFGTNGKALTDVGNNLEYAYALALQPDGKIVLAGHCNRGGTIDFCAIRYDGGPFGYKNCSLDIDGDNRVLATTDSLIHTRIALGITGPAVVTGITFPATATRNTWPLIRDYLVTQCGMSLVQ